MSTIPKVPSSKSKDVGLAAVLNNAMTSFDRANLVLREIESFLETELADTPQLSGSYDTITRPKSKRKRGPFLIKDISKNKTRKTLNDMVYDPVLGVWVGNPDALKGFAMHPPTITSKTRIDKSKALGGMVYDPVAHKWIGNDPDLRLFEKRKVPLITGEFKIKGWRIAFNAYRFASLRKRRGDWGCPLLQQLSPVLFNVGEINGMSFDPVKMTWIGGDDDMPDFGTSSDAIPQKDDGFVVGTEFQLSPTTTQQFTACAESHKSTTGGWWREEKTRDYLFVIRTMSVMRMVRDVRRSVTSYYEEPSFMDIAPEKDIPLRSPREPEADFDDAWDDMGPFDGAKLKLRDDAVDDLDAELDKLSKEDKEKKFASFGHRSLNKPIVDEDWDEDFAAEDLKILPTKLNVRKPIPSFNPDSPTPTLNITASPSPNITGTITNLSKGGSLNKKPFELLKSDAPHRRSFQMLPVERKPAKIAWEDDDEGGLEIPSGPLRLKPTLSNGNSHAEEKEDDFDDEDVPAQAQDPDNGEEEDVEEEVWDDVALPASFGEPVTKRAPAPVKTQPPEVEEWDDFEIPADKLELKVSQNNTQRQHKSTRSARGDDDDLDGIDIPEGIQLRLKR
eukprot:Phypoly_transcript_03920.p1 GENE.Phypoly_transcript_03920~~Phypoly_transcript_03920.p1  ORF type:complete len:617 (+),score=140.75 Phypoly_transcript_03920:120-1970(+)